jgi:hypothetical protein
MKYVEPTGADSPSQNGGVEIFNGTLAVRVRTLLYGSGLLPKFWSSALLHAVYIQNRLVHSATRITPYEGWYGRRPDLSHLKCFGSRVCVKETGSRRCKLDKHVFTGIFLGYTATDLNIIYLDTTSGVVKTSHHAVFDEAWYLQDSRPPAAKLLYVLGLEADDTPPAHTSNAPPPRTLPVVPWPPTPALANLPKDSSKWYPPSSILHTHLPLRVSQKPPLPITAQAAWLHPTSPGGLPKSKKQIASEVVTEYLIGQHGMDTIYMSPDPYGQSFEESIDLRKCDLTAHMTGGLCFLAKDDRLVLASIDPSSPGARIDKWRTQLRGAWLVSINDHPVHSLSDVRQELLIASTCNPSSGILLFSHPEVASDISNRGVPIMSPTDFTQYTHDQLNNRSDLLVDVEPTAPHVLRTRYYDIVTSGDLRQSLHGSCASLVVASFNRTAGVTGRGASSYSWTSTTINTASGNPLRLHKKMWYST